MSQSNYEYEKSQREQPMTFDRFMLNNWLKILIAVIVFILILMAGIPPYQVYSNTLSGKAQLMKQEQIRKILIEQARAEKEAAVLRAEAIETIGEAARKYPEYRLQEFIGAFAEALNNGGIDKIIYVPTEANIPIVEAGRIPKETP